MDETKSFTRRNLMEQLQPIENLAHQPSHEKAGSKAAAIASPARLPQRRVIPQAGESCPTCAEAANSNSNAPPAYVFAIGKVDWRFPNQSVEKEFAQVTGRTETTGLTDRQTIHRIFSERQNRYLVRQLCWVLAIEGLETYLLMPRDSSDLDLLVEAIRPAPSPMDLDTVIGVRGPIAPPEMCNGLMIPIVVFDQIFSFDRNELIQAIPRPEAIAAEQFTPAAEELLERIMQIADNAGATDEHRALNYLAVRYPAIYAKAAESYGQDSSLTAVEVRPSRLSGTRKIVDVIFAFTHRNTDVTEKYFVRVDVTDEFPFLVTKLSPFYDR
jgi:PatG C-terminal